MNIPSRSPLAILLTFILSFGALQPTASAFPLTQLTHTVACLLGFQIAQTPNENLQDDSAAKAEGSALVESKPRDLEEAIRWIFEEGRYEQKKKLLEEMETRFLSDKNFYATVLEEYERLSSAGNILSAEATARMYSWQLKAVHEMIISFLVRRSGTADMRDRLFKLLSSQETSQSIIEQSLWVPILNLSFRHGFTSEIADYFDERYNHVDLPMAFAEVSDATFSGRQAKLSFANLLNFRKSRLVVIEHSYSAHRVITDARQWEVKRYAEASKEVGYGLMDSPGRQLSSFLRTPYFKVSGSRSDRYTPYDHILGETERKFGDPIIATIFRLLKYGVAQEVRLHYILDPRPYFSTQVVSLSDDQFYNQVLRDQILSNPNLLPESLRFELRLLIRFALNKLMSNGIPNTVSSALGLLRSELKESKDIDIAFANLLLRSQMKDVYELLNSEPTDLVQIDPDQFLNAKPPARFWFKNLVTR
jgi:hypothetical protein